MVENSTSTVYQHVITFVYNRRRLLDFVAVRDRHCGEPWFPSLAFLPMSMHDLLLSLTGVLMTVHPTTNKTRTFQESPDAEHSISYTHYSINEHPVM